MALSSAFGERAVGDGGARGRDKHAAADARRRAPRQRKYCAELCHLWQAAQQSSHDQRGASSPCPLRRGSAPRRCCSRKLQRRVRLPRPLNASAAAASAGVAAVTSGVAARDTSRSVTGPRRLPRGDSCRSPCGHSALSAAPASLRNKSFLRR